MGSTFKTPTNTHPLTFFYRQYASIVFFLSFHPISSPEARNISNLTRKHNDSFLCMLYIISFFIFSFLPLVLLLRFFLFFFLNIHFYQKVSSFKISHPCILSFIHSYSFCVIYFCHPSKGI